MLVIVSEFDCLEKLNARGIYPDEYFTDIYAFKERCIAFEHATVVLITAGLSRFSRQRIVEVTKLLQSQAEDKNFYNIDNFLLVTDMQFRLKEYYRYSPDFSTFDKYDNFKKVDSDVNLIEVLRECSSSERTPRFVKLHRNDEGYTTLDVFDVSNMSSTELEMYKRIKRPHVKDIIDA